MKKNLFILIISIISISTINAQQDKTPLFRFLHKRGYRFNDSIPSAQCGKWCDTLYYNTIYRATLLGSPTIPFSFSNITFDQQGNYALNTALKFGYGYSWFLGDFTFNEADQITIRQTIAFGFAGDFGLQNSFLTAKSTTSFVAGAFIGLQTFSLFFGYDFIEKSSVFGLVTRLDLYTIFPALLKPFGKVRELSGHRKEAIRIKDNQY
jgi:hypothetical protein